MERIVYKDCGACNGKGWYYTGNQQIECADCAFKNGAEAMKAWCVESIAEWNNITEFAHWLSCGMDAYSLKQPPLCMCEDIRLQLHGHEHDCPLLDSSVPV